MAESHDHVSCSDVVELVTDYLERALPPDEAALFEQHLNFCEGCVWYVDQIRATIETVGRITPEEVPPEIESLEATMEIRAYRERPAASAPATTVAVAAPKAAGTIWIAPSPGRRSSNRAFPIFSSAFTRALERPTRMGLGSRAGSVTARSRRARGNVTPVDSSASRVAMCAAPVESAASPRIRAASTRSGIKSAYASPNQPEMV